MTQTTSQVEAAEREKFEAWFAKTHWPNEDAEEQARAFNDPSWGRLIRDSWVVWLGRAALASQQEVAEGDYKNMWLAAVSTLAKIDALLGLPEDGCNDPDYTLSALQDYMAGVAEVTRTDVPYTLDDVRAWIKQGQDRAASQQEVAAPVGDDVETMAASRYHIDKTEGGFWPYVVRCGNGTQVLHKGHLTSCQRLAQQLKTAFLDGAFVANKRVKADAALDATIKQRDRGHRFADEMAAQIAAITGSDIGEHSSSNCPWQQAVRAADDFLAAARVPVASPAEPIKVTDAMVETYLTANDDYWARTDQMPDKNPSKWRQGTPKEATRESLNAVFALLATPPVGAGGAGVMDARPDSFHSDSGASFRVQGAGREPVYHFTDGDRSIKQDVLSAIGDFARIRPEDDESWESWYGAAFDMLGERTRGIFSEHEQRTLAANSGKGKAENVVANEMINRFLAWKLPTDFCPDCGISFDGRKDDELNKNKTWPTGTNLLTADQARAMFEHILAKGGDQGEGK